MIIKKKMPTDDNIQNKGYNNAYVQSLSKFFYNN